MHEVHGRRNCDHRSLSKCTEQSKDRIGLITDDDDQCNLTPAYMEAQLLHYARLLAQQLYLSSVGDVGASY